MSNRKLAGPILLIIAAALALGLAVAGQTPGQTAAAGQTTGVGQSQAAPPAAPAAQAPPPTQQPPAELAEAHYKNIQVFKGIPASQLIPTMNFMAASLGVQCNFCHVPNEFEKDDKQNKQTARKMITMTMGINKDSFERHRQVTCNSCHNGHQEPSPNPAIPQGPQPAAERPGPGGPGAVPGAPGAPSATPPPTVDQIIEKYVQALGGPAAIEKITSRTAKGSLSTRGFQLPLEVYQKAPNKQVMITHTPGGDAAQGFDGETAWVINPDGRSEQPSAQQIVRAKRNSDIHRALHFKEIYVRMRLARMEKIGDRDTYVVFAFPRGDSFEQLHFDVQTGLLVRSVTLEETALGGLPTQLDFEDYRDVDGVKLPFRIRSSTPDRTITIQFDDVKLNVPVDDAKFAKPAAK
jgi:outer membrane lipoprotein-sorting protein